jgi:hypothetical protein
VRVVREAEEAMNKNLKQGIEFFALREAWLGAGGKPAPQETSEMRASICLQCPYHDTKTGLLEGLKKNIAHQVRRQLEVRSQMKLHVYGEERLHLCGVCGCVLVLLVHVPEDILVEHLKTDSHDYPSYCWKGQLKQKQNNDKSNNRLR